MKPISNSLIVPIAGGIASCVGVTMFLVIIENFSIIYSVFLLEELDFASKSRIISALFFGLFFDISLKSILLVCTSVLFGILFGMIVYLVRLNKAQAVSVVSLLTGGGFVSALLGIGCISCGALLTAVIASLIGTSSVLFLFPLGGIEFSILALVLLCISIYQVFKQIRTSK